MQEFTRQAYNLDPIPFRLVSSQDHRSPVWGARIPAYYISNNGQSFELGTGQIREVSQGWYELTLGRNEQDSSPRLVSIPGIGGLPGYDPVYWRVVGDKALEIVAAIQTMTYLMMFVMVASFDHISPVSGLAPGVTITRDGSAWTALETAQEIGRGFYGVPVPTFAEVPTSEWNNECVYLIKANASGADVTYDAFQVFRYDDPA